MTNEHAANMEFLNVVQQVLKGALLAIAAAARADLVECATLMQAQAENPHLDGRAVAMLHDLATGFDMLGRAARGQTNDG